MPLKFGAKVTLIYCIKKILTLLLSYLTSAQSKINLKHNISVLQSYINQYVYVYYSIFAAMNIQTIIVILLFTGALFYVGRMVYKNLFTKKSCGGNCKCGVDFSGIEPRNK